MSYICKPDLDSLTDCNALPILTRHKQFNRIKCILHLINRFILGFPANEIVVPIIIMAYSEGTALTEISELSALKDLFISNGWTSVTAICMVIFVLFHFPCSTSCITVYKETKSLKWTAVSFALPTVIGIALCIAVNGICTLSGIA